ncbi:hypothetical protein NC651_011450 [Populus alba x Populus x berolinensis]|nr:hypothetical protein NC651_011450 [Populus alba x Populus x berolinensis]
MLSGYAKSGMTNRARKLFDKMPKRDVVSWNTMVIGFYKELRRLGIGYNGYSFAGLLRSWAAGFLCKIVISSLVADAYAKCGEMSDATRLFDGMNVKDVLTWTTMNSVSWTLISGYVRHGLVYTAPELLTNMMVLGTRPNQFAFISSLCACASLASVKLGKHIDGYLIRKKFRPNTIVQGVVLWNPMIYALAQHDHGEEAIQMFDDMVGNGLRPDKITLVEGLRLLESIIGGNCFFPDQEHYAHLIDLLGQARHFDKLTGQLENMHCKINEQIWNALISVSEQRIELEPQSPAAYILLSSVYAELGRWDLVEKVENKVHAFTASDRLHPLKEVIYSFLEQVVGWMEEEVSSPIAER